MTVGREEQIGADGIRITGDVHAGRDFIGRDKVVYGDEIGRDQIINHGQLIYQQARSAAEEAEQARALDAARLAQGVADYVKRLLAVAAAGPRVCDGGPYRGLAAYGLGDAALFFGRETTIQVVGEHLQRSRLTVIQSESGAGKTSLLQAGVAPRLLTGGHLPLMLRPYAQSPAHAIKQAFLPDIAAFAATPLRAFLRQVTAVLGPDAILFIILDQFEEFFTRLTDPSARAAFVSDLAECLEDPGLNVRWVLALRSDSFGDLASFRPRIRSPFENDFRLNRLTPQDAADVIVKPAEQCGLAFEPGLVDALLADLAQPDGRIAPPQVQLVCLALYEAYQDRKAADPGLAPLLTLDLYRQEGGARGILHDHLNRVLLRALPQPAQRDLARQLLIALVSSDGRRVRRAKSALAGEAPAADVDAALGELVANRLVNVEQGDAQGEATYELAHDYLLDEIKIAPEVLAQKAAQELLDQEVEAHRRFGTLLSADKYEIIHSQRPHLKVSADADALLLQTARTRRLNRMRTVFLVSLIPLLILVAVGWRLYDQYRAERPFSLEREARESKQKLDHKTAIEKFAASRDAASAAGVPLDFDVRAEISDTLRYVATQWTYQGEELIRQAQAASGAERQQRFQQAAQRFQDAQELHPPTDAHIYVLIPAGPFLMGMNEGELYAALVLCRMDRIECGPVDFEHEQPQHTLHLDAYWIMRTEVTNEQYGRCVRTGICTEPANARWKLALYGREPVTDVTWAQARTYAAWVGGRLPTEAEWEKACRGNAGNIFPWGNALPSAERANYAPAGLNGPAVVGSFPSGAFGLYNMAGNVEEWTASLWGTSYDAADFGYPYNPNDGRENAEAPNDMMRVFRGGSFHTLALGVSCMGRGRIAPDSPASDTGFRVVLPAS